jgi:hypothetical protein
LAVVVQEVQVQQKVQLVQLTLVVVEVVQERLVQQVVETAVAES